MSELSRTRKLPSDVTQLNVVWRYEILKYMRSRRLLSAIVIVIAITALIYAIPPLVGSDYRGTITNDVLYTEPLNVSMPGTGVTFYNMSSLSPNTIDLSSLELTVNGTPFPSNNGANWIFTNSGSIAGLPISANTILFTQDMSGKIVTASYNWKTPVQDFDTRFVNFASLLIVICATFFGADSIVGEFQNRTGYLMFPNPIKRMSIFLGKYAASMTVGVIVVGLFYLAVGGLSLLTLGGVDDDFGMSFAYALEFLVAVMAVAYLISSVLKGSTGALVLTFFLFMMILPIVDGVSMVAGVKVQASLTFSSNVMLYTMSDPYPKDTVSPDFGGMTFHQYYPDPALSAIVMLIYAVIAIALSLVLFQKKQLVG